MLCAGCGQPLPPGSGRGRPARYHGATCRQRARRTRLAASYRPVLSTLANLETAAGELRQAILNSRDTTEAHTRLASAAVELTHQLGHAPNPLVLPTPSDPVTKAVPIAELTPLTDQTASRPAMTDPIEVVNATAPEPTAEKPCTVVIKTVDLTEEIGPGWTLVQHDGDAEASLWHVQQHGRAIGSVSRSYHLTTNTRGWEARTANYNHVPAIGKLAASRRSDHLWRTRNSAAAGIAYRVSMLARSRNTASK